jgi:signal transduction histidine kinase
LGTSRRLHHRHVLLSLKGQQRALEAEIVERKQAEEALRASQDSLRRSNAQIQGLAGRPITAQQAERVHIARELHDDISQQLATLSIAFSGLKRRLPSEAAEAQQEVVRLQQQTVALSEAIRHLSHKLHPGVRQHAGLVAALQGDCTEFSSQHAIDVTFHADAGLEEIPADVALCLYRVAQEALRNMARHAGARQAEVAVTRSDDILEADAYVEMYTAFNDGRIQSTMSRNTLHTTPTTLEEFAREVFAPASQAS